MDIQAFGSNDTLTTSDVLTIGIERPDGTHQNYNIANPNNASMVAATIQAAVVTATLEKTTAAALFIDSKDGTAMTTQNGYKVGTAYRTEKTIRTLDLS